MFLLFLLVHYTVVVNKTFFKTMFQTFFISRPVIFNRGSAEPKGSASICQGFRSASKNNLTCEITPDRVVKNQHRTLRSKLSFFESIFA